MVKVMGLSNYHCKLLAPILARYGMDKQTGKAKLLRDMNQGDVFECSLLGDRAFLIEPEHVDTVGYGKDRSGSLLYLHDTLEDIKRANGNLEELFWHALRENLKKHLKENLDRYKALFHDFIDVAEWEDIINECDPWFLGGVPQDLIRKYVKLEEDGSCVIGGDRSLQDKYLLRLVAAMEEVFMDKHGIHPSLVADVHQYFYRRTGVIGIQPEEVTAAAKKAVLENRLHKCLICGALSELLVPPEWLAPGGKLYNLAKTTHGHLKPDKNYSFPLNNIVCSYDAINDILVPDFTLSNLTSCNWCRGNSVRRVRSDSSIVYLDGDRTNTRSYGGKCGCGFKHYWDGKEYDNLPEAFPITLEWGGRVVRETVYWFQYEK
ncbi:unnamed protein product [Ranitomeya imitator]|uniref:Deubiquitinating protein VCPIP1 N-terminal domain-containing protein n=1 Tax=Ranitomeya imitator TaxID=111125 RepID=A0ABN9MKD9_9NEOB|nr:unnamed protein product [Ranitomeya imitator]